MTNYKLLMTNLKKIAAIGGVAVMALLPLLAAAQTPIVEPKPVTGDPLQQLFGILNTLTNWLLTALIVLAGIFVVYAGYKYLLAAGDPEAVGTAKNVLIYAAVAVAVGLLAKVIVAIAQALVK